jgi:hypothetical protein
MEIMALKSKIKSPEKDFFYQEASFANQPSN